MRRETLFGTSLWRIALNSSGRFATVISLPASTIIMKTSHHQTFLSAETLSLIVITCYRYQDSESFYLRVLLQISLCSTIVTAEIHGDCEGVFVRIELCYILLIPKAINPKSYRPCSLIYFSYFILSITFQDASPKCYASPNPSTQEERRRCCSRKIYVVVSQPQSCLQAFSLQSPSA